MTLDLSHRTRSAPIEEVRPEPVPKKPQDPWADFNLNLWRDALERAKIKEALDASGGSITEAGYKLKLGRTTLVGRMQKLGIEPLRVVVKRERLKLHYGPGYVKKLKPGPR